LKAQIQIMVSGIQSASKLLSDCRKGFAELPFGEVHGGCFKRRNLPCQDIVPRDAFDEDFAVEIFSGLTRQLFTAGADEKFPSRDADFKRWPLSSCRMNRAGQHGTAAQLRRGPKVKSREGIIEPTLFSPKSQSSQRTAWRNLSGRSDMLPVAKRAEKGDGGSKRRRKREPKRNAPIGDGYEGNLVLRSDRRSCLNSPAPSCAGDAAPVMCIGRSAPPSIVSFTTPQY